MEQAEVLDILKNYVKEGEASLERHLSRCKDSGERHALLQALEVNIELERELERLPAETKEYEHQPIKAGAAGEASFECFKRAQYYSALLKEGKELSDETRALLQKLVAAEDQTVIRLRQYL